MRGWLGSFVWILMTHFVYDMFFLKIKLGDNFDVSALIRRHRVVKYIIMGLIAAYELTISIRTYIAREH